MTFVNLTKTEVSYSVALDKSTDINDMSQLDISVLSVNDQFEITEEVLSMNPLQGCTIAKGVFQLLCDS